MLNIYDIYKLEVGVFMYKHYTNQLPDIFKDYFVKQDEVHDYHTRNTTKYCFANNKKAFSDQTIRVSGPVLWNSLTTTLKNSKSTKHFKHQFKEYLIKSYE